jgi:hypothetical protein
LIDKLSEQRPREHKGLIVARPGENAEALAQQYLEANPHVDIAFVINVHNTADPEGVMKSVSQWQPPKKPGQEIYTERKIALSEPEGVKDPDAAFKAHIAQRDKALAAREEFVNPFKGWHPADIRAYLEDMPWEELTEDEKEIARRLALHAPHDKWEWMI